MDIYMYIQDSTLILTASGSTFPRGPTDWKWWHTSVPKRLRDLDSNGYVHPYARNPRLILTIHQKFAHRYQVIIVSNQAKISIVTKAAAKKAKVAGSGGAKGLLPESKSLSNFKEKMTMVMKRLGLSLVSVYAAAEDDSYRKPRLGMWRQLLADYHLDDLDVDASFCVGDAAGRVGDHSNSDRWVMYNNWFSNKKNVTD